MKLKLITLILAAVMLLASCNGGVIETTPVESPIESPEETPVETPEETPAETDPPAPTEIMLNGERLSSYVIVVDKVDDVQGNRLATVIKQRTEIELPVVVKGNEGDHKNIIAIGAYGERGYNGYRCVITAHGSRICLDGETGATQILATDHFIEKYLSNDVLATMEINVAEKEAFYNHGYSSSKLTLKSETVTEVYEGVSYIKRKYVNKDGKSVMVHLSIISPEMVKGICLAAPPLGKTMTLTNQMKKAEQEGKEVILGMNAGFFHLQAGTNLPYGLCLTDGVLLSEIGTSTKNNKLWFGITKEGKAACGNYTSYQTTYKSILTQGVTGSIMFIDNYRANSLSTGSSPDPRTVVAVCEDGTVIFLCVDGRTTVSAGANTADIMEILLRLEMNVVNALNLDGGGSTTMAYKKDGDIKLANYPSNSGGGTQRAVQSVLLVTVPK